MSTRPPQKIVPTAKLAADNAGDLELTSHRRAVVCASVAFTDPQPNCSSPLPGSSPPPQTDVDDAPSPAPDSSQGQSSTKRPSQSVKSSLSLDSVIIVSPTTSDDAPDVAPKTKKPKNSQALGDVHADISVIDIDDIENPQDEPLNRSNASADIKQFFTVVPRLPGQVKGCMRCNLCT
jgi:hypothetical protein